MAVQMEKAPDPKLVRAVIDAVENYEVTQSDSWNDLSILSNNTLIDGIDVDPAGIIFENGNFKGIMNVYVVLRYGSKKDSFETTESFRGHFSGHLEQGSRPVIDRMSVDTSPFFEGEEAGN